MNIKKYYENQSIKFEKIMKKKNCIKADIYYQ